MKMKMLITAYLGFSLMQVHFIVSATRLFVIYAYAIYPLHSDIPFTPTKKLDVVLNCLPCDRIFGKESVRILRG